MKSIPILIFASIFTFVFSPLQIFAKFCACCAERGEYSISVRKPDSYEIGELNRLQIAETTLFTDAGYPDNIKGISPLADEYSASFVWQKNSWKFNFENTQNGRGILNLLNSPTMVDYRTDTYNEGEPVLYKELRFKYKVLSGTGFFQKGIAPASQYLLVFQGKGNNCMSAEQFSTWRLEITGKKANYAFFGKLKVKD